VHNWLLSFAGSGELEFEEFVTLAARFLVEEDAEAMQQELREAFRLYDKEGKLSDSIRYIYAYYV
jgi:Ca2+-binding EF-hand superfamily protein